MDLQEFKSLKPEFVSAAKNCKDESEFTKLAEKNGIKFGKNCLKKAYDLFCIQSNGELSEESLKNVSGGTDFNISELGLGYGKDTFIFTDK